MAVLKITGFDGEENINFVNATGGTDLELRRTKRMFEKRKGVRTFVFADQLTDVEIAILTNDGNIDLRNGNTDLVDGNTNPNI